MINFQLSYRNDLRQNPIFEVKDPGRMGIVFSDEVTVRCDQQLTSYVKIMNFSLPKFKT